MSDHTPDRWEIVRFKNQEKTWYKILGSWSGGYLDGDAWRLSSGLESIEEDGDYYLMKNYSGSVYKCHKNGRGMNVISSGMYSKIEKTGKENNVEVSIIGVEEYKKDEI